MSEHDATFFAERASGIGGSDAACCLDCHPFETRFELYARLLDCEAKSEAKEPLHLWLGNQMEPIALAAYERVTRRIVNRGGFARHEEYRWMIAHPDGLVSVPGSTLYERGVECKLAGPRNWREWGPQKGQVPQAYYCQCQHYAQVYGGIPWDLGVLLGTEFRIDELAYDVEFGAALLDAEKTAWAEVENLRALRNGNELDRTRFVERMAQIKQASEENKAAMLGRVFPFPKQDHLPPVPEGCVKLFSQLCETKANLDAEQGNFEELSNKVKAIIGDEKGYACAEGKVIWRKQGKGRAFIVELNEEHAT